MAISVTGVRPKLTSTTPLNLSLLHKTPVENSNYYRVRTVLDDIEPDPITITSLATDTGLTTITASAGTFSNIRVGDVVSHASAINTGTTVTDVNTDSSEITLSEVPLETSGSVDLVFTPGTLDATLYILELGYNLSNYTLTITPKIYTFDGSATSDLSGTDDDELTISEATSTSTLSNVVINLDSFLTKARDLRE
jgi:hypothetical protein